MDKTSATARTRVCILDDGERAYCGDDLFDRDEWFDTPVSDHILASAILCLDCKSEYMTTRTKAGGE